MSMENMDGNWTIPFRMAPEQVPTPRVGTRNIVGPPLPIGPIVPGAPGRAPDGAAPYPG